MALKVRGLISERTQEGMNQLKATNQRFTHSIFGWDAQEDGSLVPNWREQNAIDVMAWQVNENGMSATAVARDLNKKGWLEEFEVEEIAMWKQFGMEPDRSLFKDKSDAWKKRWLS